MTWEAKTLDSCTAWDVLSWCKLRTDVFFLEQHITEEEIDSCDFDPRTWHVWARHGEHTVGYVRVVTRDHPEPADRGVATSIGRLVVARSHRGQGLARDLMLRALNVAGNGPIVLHAQTYIQHFYSQLGFEAFGEQFDEAGIWHIRMLRPAQ